jgi:hypothetical protein
MDLADGKRDVVDPEVRAYVSSLVTAVSHVSFSSYPVLTLSSWEEVVPTKTDDTYLETMLWHVYAI